MNYRDFFDEALSEAYTEAPVADDKEFIGTIYERAKGMSNKKEKVRQMKLTEITPEYVETKKSHKVFTAVAGVAGAAAVLTGAVFGVGWLNEHGGLKGPDVRDADAGYHSDIEPAQSAEETTNAIIASEDVRGKIEIEAAGKAVNGIVPMDETVVLDGEAVHFTGYEFDSAVVTFYYDIIGTTRSDIRPMGINGAVYGTAGGSPDNDSNMVKDCHGTVALYEPADTVRISFGRDLIDLTDKSCTTDDEAFAVTVHSDPDCVVKKAMLGAVENEVKTLIIDDAYVTPTHVTAVVNRYFKRPPDDLGKAEISVIMRDGTVIGTHMRSTITADDDSGLAWIVRKFDEPIDINEVSEVQLDECRLDSEEISSIYPDYFFPVTVPPEENRHYLTDAHVETENCDITINWLTFDGLTLRLQYDVTFKNGLPEDGTVPTIVPCGDNNIEPNISHGTRVDLLGTDGDTASCLGEVVYNRVMSGEPLKLRFRHFTREGEEELISFLDENVGMIVLEPETPDVPIAEYEINKEVSFKWGDKIPVESVTVCRDSVMITFEYSHAELAGKGFSLHDTYLEMADGSRKILDTIEDCGGTENSGGTVQTGEEGSKLWWHYELSEPIDPSAVKNIVICGELVYREGGEPALTVGSSFQMSDGTTATIASAQFDGFVCKIVWDIHSDDPDYFDKVFYTAQNGVETYHIKILAERYDGVADCATTAVPLSSDENGCTIRVIEHFLPTDDSDGYPIVRRVVDCSGEYRHTAGYITILLTEPSDTMVSTTVSDEVTGDREIDISPLGFRIHQQNSDYDLYANGTVTVTCKDGTVREIAAYTGGWYSLVSDEQLLDGTFDEPLDLSEVYSIELYDSTVVIPVRSGDIPEETPAE
ncbi:MAG: hypothetical protein IJT87_07705 [Ruminiclostridium sp.]|nr:hypothetical protein [Ruminiclostridium sp.]